MRRQEAALRKESQRFHPEEASGSSCARCTRPAVILTPQPSYTAPRSEMFCRSKAQELSTALCLPELLPTQAQTSPTPPPRPTSRTQLSTQPQPRTCVSLQPMRAGSPLSLCWLFSFYSPLSSHHRSGKPTPKLQGLHKRKAHEHVSRDNETRPQIILKVTLAAPARPTNEPKQIHDYKSRSERRQLHTYLRQNPPFPAPAPLTPPPGCSPPSPRPAINTTGR